MAVKIARVLPISGIEKLLDYRVPPTVENSLKLGCLVRIPIRNRQELGVVMEFPEKGQLPPDKLKQITQQVMEHPALTVESTELLFWMHDYYGAGYESLHPCRGSQRHGPEARKASGAKRDFFSEGI